MRGRWCSVLLAQVPGSVACRFDMPTLTPAVDADAGTTPFFPEWVISLQSAGSLRPIFVFPTSHSDPSLRTVTHMAHQIGADHPVWGFAHTELHRDLVRREGVQPLGAEYVAQIRAIQPTGPYLLFGNCMGGYLAWETARQLLAQGEAISGMAFFEVPLRAEFSRVRTGPLPVEATNVWRLGHYYAPPSLPVRLTHVMTAHWASAGWWRPWQQVASMGMETVLLPDGSDLPHAERLAGAIRDWSSNAGPA